MQSKTTLYSESFIPHYSFFYSNFFFIASLTQQPISVNYNKHCEYFLHFHQYLKSLIDSQISFKQVFQAQKRTTLRHKHRFSKNSRFCSTHWSSPHHNDLTLYCYYQITRKRLHHNFYTLNIFFTSHFQKEDKSHSSTRDHDRRRKQRSFKQNTQ